MVPSTMIPFPGNGPPASIVGEKLGERRSFTRVAKVARTIHVSATFILLRIDPPYPVRVAQTN